MEESLSMEFTTLTEEEFRKFYLAHPLKTFLQSPEIGMLRVKSGWQVDYVGVKKEGYNYRSYDAVIKTSVFT